MLFKYRCGYNISLNIEPLFEIYKLNILHLNILNN